MIDLAIETDMSADVNLGTNLVLYKFTVVYGLIHYTVLFLFRARIMNSTSRPTTCDKPPVGRSQGSCSWGSPGESPSRNSAGTEPQEAAEFTTVGAQRGAKLFRCRLVIRRPVSPAGTANRYQRRGDRYSSVPAGTSIGRRDSRRRRHGGC